METFSGIFDTFYDGRQFRILVSFPKEVPENFEDDFSKNLKKKNYDPANFFLHFITMADLCKVIESALLELGGGDGCIACEEDALLPRTIFAQDPFSVLEGAHGINYILNCIYPYLNFAYGYIGPALIDQAFNDDYAIKPCQFTFNGANILAGEDYLLIGSDSVTFNADQMGLETAKVLDMFKTYYGVDKIFEIGSPVQYPKEPTFSQGEWQPVFHIDMYITLGGTINEKNETREEAIFVGKLELIPANTNEAEIAKQEVAALELLRQVRSNLNKTAKHISSEFTKFQKVKVLRFPLLLDLGTGNYISWNNCLVENYGPGNKRIVYLPDYCTEENSPYEVYQQQVIDTLEENGFECMLVDNEFLKYALQYRGSLHCMVKVLRRGGYA